MHRRFLKPQECKVLTRYVQLLDAGAIQWRLLIFSEVVILESQLSPLADKYSAVSVKIQHSSHLPFSNASGTVKVWENEFPSGEKSAIYITNMRLRLNERRRPHE